MARPVAVGRGQHAAWRAGGLHRRSRAVDLERARAAGASVRPRSPPTRSRHLGRPPRSPRRVSCSPSQPHRTVRSFGSVWKVTPWSTPYRCPSGIASTCPPLRSALLTSTSKTAIRRSCGVSSWTRETGVVLPVDAVEDVAPARRAPRPRARCRRPTCSSSGSCHSWTMPGAVRPVAEEGVRHDVPAAAPRRRRTPPPRGRRGCRRGSPTAAARRGSACRRPGRRRSRR